MGRRRNGRSFPTRHKVGVVGLVLAGGAVAVELGRLAEAGGESERARTAALSVAGDVRELERLRRAGSAYVQGPPSERDVLSLVNQALAEAGVPSRHFDSLRPEGDSAVPGRRDVRRRMVRLSLKEVAVADVGTFLEALGRERSGWTVDSIELTHMPGRRSRADAWALALVLAAPYAAEGGS